MGAILPGFSTRIDLRCIERRSRRLLGAGYLFSAVVLAVIALTWHAPPRLPVKAEKPDYIMHADIIERSAPPSEEPFRVNPPKFAHRMTRPGISAPGTPSATPGSAPLSAFKEPPLSFEREIGRSVDRLSQGYTDNPDRERRDSERAESPDSIMAGYGPRSRIVRCGRHLPDGRQNRRAGIRAYPALPGGKAGKIRPLQFQPAGSGRRNQPSYKHHRQTRSAASCPGRQPRTTWLPARRPAILPLFYTYWRTVRTRLPKVIASNSRRFWRRTTVVFLILDNGEPGKRDFP